MDFRDAHIRNSVYFIGSKIKNGSILFTSAHIDGELTFAEAEINRNIWLADSEIGLQVSFNKTNIEGNIYLDGAIINHMISFDDATIKGNIYFRKSKINDIISLDFEKLKGELIFEDTSFRFSGSQEIACRKARGIYEDMRDKIKSDEYFYLEMEAKRQQKGLLKAEEASFLRAKTLREENLGLVKRFLWYDLIEFALLQVIFGYGVHPRRVIFSWVFIIPFFAVAYWAAEGMNGWLPGIQNYLESSFAAAIAPGYIAVVINSTTHTTTLYHLMAILETIIGTFLWAGFIATFARKYMR